MNNNRARFKRSYNRIEIIITYECNRKCLNCEAMVRQAPSNESMSLQQIEKFVLESTENKLKWDSIRVLGGEPTLHKDIFGIFELLNNYKQKHSNETKLTLITNGYGDYVKNVIKKLTDKYDIEIENTNKTSDIQTHFSPINQAPMDLEHLKNHDLTKACWIPPVCGIALDLHGYYSCSAAAAIDRVFGFDIARKKLPANDDSMEDMFKQFCKLCGYYYAGINDLVNFDMINEDDYKKLDDVIAKNKTIMEGKMNTIESIISPTWDNALKRWAKNKPVLSMY